MPDRPEQLAYTVDAAAESLAISRAQIWRLVKDKKIPVIKLSPRCVRILKQDLEQFLQDLRN